MSVSVCLCACVFPLMMTHVPLLPSLPAACTQESLPSTPLSGMLNKHGEKVRLTFKLETDELWIGTKGEWLQVVKIDQDGHLYLQ